MHLAIGLPLRNQAALSNLLADIYDPASPRFHQYLSVEQFTAMFGPSEADYQKLKDFAQANNLTVSATHPNRLLLDVRASVADIEKAFHINLRLYQHPTESRAFFAPDSEPTLDTEVPVLHISGLDDFVKPQPASLHMRPLDTQNPTPQAGSGPGGTYRGLDFKNAFAPGLSVNGSNQMVALVEFDGYYANDITLYATQASLPTVNRINVLLDDFSGAPGSANIEVALDIEMVISMSSGVSAIIVYEGQIPIDVLNRIATDNLAHQVSTSWTFGFDTNMPQVFMEYAAQGQSYFNASGDAGAYTSGAPNPTDQAYITSVGGTTLSTTGPLGSWVSEKSWNWNNTGQGTAATGGGISTVVPIPSWQQSTSMASNGGSITMRNGPDVAMVADNIYIVANNGTGSSIGGTSAAAPLWAAYIALVNQQAASLGQPPVGFINPAVYAIGNGPGYSTNFHDTVTGNNTNTASPSQFYAVAGYDLCTGWGSPIGNKLINTLAPRVSAILVTNASSQLIVEGCNPANGVLDPDETVTYLFGLKNIGGFPTTNLVATLLATGGVTSPSAPATYGSLASGGSTVTRQFTFTAAGTCGGTVTATLQLMDNSTPLGNITFPISLGKPVTTFSQNFDSASRPALPSGWTTAVSGAATAWITSATLRDTTPNAAFVLGQTNPGVAELTSPLIPISTTNAQLIFRQNYSTEIDPAITNRGYDGGVLEISISNSPFADILAAGGAFLNNGYVRTLDPTNNNPLAGRQAWAGLSSNFVTTVAVLPASAAGQNIQLKWRFGMDFGNFFGQSSWYVDTILINDGIACCNSNADIAISQAASTNQVTLGQNLTYNIAVTNLGGQPTPDVLVTDSIPANVTFVSASPGCVYSNGIVVCDAGAMNSGGTTGVTVTVTPLAVGFVTNIVSAGSPMPDPSLANNYSTNITPVTSANTAPSITLQPTNVIIFQGSNANFRVLASGVPSPTYQWLFSGTNLPGATATILSIANAQASNIGNYQAIATNVAGAATSSVAHLTVLISPVIQVASGPGTNVAVSVNSVSGLNYRLEYKNSLDDPGWLPIQPAVLSSGGTIILLDTNAPPVPARFYRVTAF